MKRARYLPPVRPVTFDPEPIVLALRKLNIGISVSNAHLAWDSYCTTRIGAKESARIPEDPAVLLALLGPFLDIVDDGPSVVDEYGDERCPLCHIMVNQIRYGDGGFHRDGQREVCKGLMWETK